MGKSGKTESGKRIRVQAGRALNPVTLLGGLQAPRITSDTDTICAQDGSISSLNHSWMGKLHVFICS